MIGDMRDARPKMRSELRILNELERKFKLNPWYTDLENYNLSIDSSIWINSRKMKVSSEISKFGRASL